MTEKNLVLIVAVGSSVPRPKLKLQESTIDSANIVSKYINAYPLSGGFVPNFAGLDVGARSMLVNSGIIPFVVDLQRQTMAASSAGDDMFHSQIVNKNLRIQKLVSLYIQNCMVMIFIVQLGKIRLQEDS